VENNESIDDLILSGVVEVAAVDSDTGELLYQFTDKLPELMPDLYKKHIQKMHDDIMYFWERGFLHIHDFSIENPKISLTAKALDKDELENLSEEMQAILKEIMRVLKVV
jgi:hypothetical protein